MKKIIILLCAVSAYIVAEPYGTFFRPRPISQMSELEYALSQWNEYHSKNASCQDTIFRYSFEATGFYFHSLNSKSVGKYFSPGGLDEMRVRELNTGDVGSLWFSVMSDANTFYESTLRLRPTRDIAGGLFKGLFYFDPECGRTWAAVIVPFAYVSHKLGVEEILFTSPGILAGGSASVSQALTSTHYNFSKFYGDAQTTVLIDDIALKLGYDLSRDCQQHASMYGIAYLPTSKPSDAVYLFEPLLGNGRHFGLGGGVNIDKHIWGCDHRRIHWLSDLRLAYYFKGKEKRSLDLNNGNWSRYFTVEFLPNALDPSQKKGVNFFSGNVNVTPGAMIDFWTALHYNRRSFNIEAGYNFWWRQEENISFGKFLETFPSDLAIVPFLLNNGSVTASHATIAQSNVNGPNPLIADPSPVTITSADFDLQSAAQKSTWSSTFYIALSHELVGNCIDGMIGGGISYELSHRGALSQIGGWIKGNISF